MANLIAWLAIAGVLAFNVLVSLRVLRNGDASALQRGLQIAIIWLVPFIGAAICLSFLSADRPRVADATSSDSGYDGDGGMVADGGFAGCGDVGAGDCGGGGDGGGGGD